MSCYLREKGHPRLPYLQLPPRTLQTQEAGLDGLGVDKWELGLGSWHVGTFTFIRLFDYLWFLILLRRSIMWL